MSRLALDPDSLIIFLFAFIFKNFFTKFLLLYHVLQIRRLKDDVLMQLPPKRRQIISLVLKRSDFNFARGVSEVVEDTSTNNTEEESLDIADQPNNVESAGIEYLILFIQLLFVIGGCGHFYCFFPLCSWILFCS